MPSIIINVLRQLGVWDRVVEPELGLTERTMRRLGGGVSRLPPPFRSSFRKAAIAVSEAANKRTILDLVGNWMESLALLAVDISDRQQDHDALHLFFKLGLRVGDEPHYGNSLGSGVHTDPENCFFPNELAAGPKTIKGPVMSSKRNARIATSCAFVSVLSYRDDNDILRCMTNPDTPMLPGMAFLSVHTHSEGDLNVFVAEDLSFAIFCVRGTEYETMRDWLTSVLLNPTEFFACGSREAGGTGTGMREVRVRDRYFKQMLLACRENELEHVTDPAHSPVPRDASVSAFELVNYLHRRGCKIYYAGHSLGGGLSILFGAIMQAWDRSPAAVITFGSPPVGDDHFCEWYSESVPVSWRFVNEDEFAPMAPPLPFTEPVETQELCHVEQDLIQVEDLTARRPRGLSPDDMDRRLDWLQQHNMVSKIILDHNPVLSLFALREQANRLHVRPTVCERIVSMLLAVGE